MVTLFCFCCDHRNPAGARFCNACGTPLHLKPCKHCDAINTRAAAHCHKCGETFALEFLALDEVAERPEVPESAPVPAPVEATAPPRRQGVFRTRIVALLLGMTATALLSAYFAYRQPGIAPAAAVVVERSQPVVPVATPGPPPEAPPLATFTPPTAARSPLPSSEPSGAGAGPARAGDVKEATRPEAAKVQAASAPPTAKRNEQASAAKSKAEPPRRVARQIRSEPEVATSPPAVRPQVEERSLPDPGRMALQTIVTPPAAPARSVSVESPPAPPRRESARRPASSPGAWDRPCAEGVALDPACDVRMMPKGN